MRPVCIAVIFATQEISFQASSLFLELPFLLLSGFTNREGVDFESSGYSDHSALPLCCKGLKMNKLASSVDTIAISKIWNYHWPTADPLTHSLTGVDARRCYRIWKVLKRLEWPQQKANQNCIPCHMGREGVLKNSPSVESLFWKVFQSTLKLR